MNEQLYTGNVMGRDGVLREVVLKKGKRFWTDPNVQRYRLADGVMTGMPKGQAYPMLRLETVTPIAAVPEAKPVPQKVVAYPYEGLVKPRRGPMAWRPLRETKLRWISSTGERFDKVQGWSANYANDGLRLQVDSIKPNPAPRGR